MCRRYALEHTDGLLQKTLYPLKGEATLGRSRRSTFALKGAGVSRLHAKLSCNGGQWVIDDLKSKNGVFVNGRRVESQPLRPGDRIRLGEVDLHFVEVEEQEESTSVSDTQDVSPLTSTQEIREQMDLVRTLLKALPIGVAIIDENEDVRYHNQVLGVQSVSPERGEGSPLGVILGCFNGKDSVGKCGESPGCDLCPLREPIDRAFERGVATSDLEIPWPSEGGEAQAYFRFSILPLPYRLMGEALAMLTWEDITSRKIAQEAQYLKKERERLSSILDGNPIPTVAIDRSHRVVLWNRASEALTSIPRQEMLGKPLDFGCLYRGNAPPLLADLILEMTDEELLRRYGNRGIRRDEMHPEAFAGTGRIWIQGEERTVVFVATRLRDLEGEVVGAIQSAQDITEREQLQKQLQHAQKMEAVGTLTSGMAHEFNNILAAIQGYAQLIMLGMEADHPMLENLREIDDSCRRAAGLIRKMLTFSRLDVGEKLPVKVNSIVEGVQRLLRQTLTPQIELELALQSGLPFVMAEFSQLEQVLLNLGVNARDSMPNGGKIRFGTRPAELDKAFCRAHPWAQVGRYVEVFVEDSGEGIPAETLERIFEPFYTTKEPGKGTGLGLSIAYSIVKSHGGYIVADSELGQGSCFRIFLPAVEEPPEGVLGEAVVEDPEPEAAEALPQGNDEAVLVVDDEPQLREIARDMLASSGYRVTVAADGEEALRLYREAMDEGVAFDLVILDLAMPVMDGTDCLKHLLELDPEARVLITTGYGGELPAADFLEQKSWATLRKPFGRAPLLNEVHRVLGAEG